MNRKDWSELRRVEEITKLIDMVDYIQNKIEHLQSEDWQKPYPNKEGV